MISGFLPPLADYATRGAVILLMAWLTTILLRRGTAAARHAVWVAALAVIAVLPATLWLAPSIAVQVPELASAHTATRVTHPQGVANQHTRVASVGAERGGTMVQAEEQAVAISAPRRGLTNGDLGSLLVLVWMVGAGVLLLRFAFGALIVRRRALHADAAIDADWVMLARELAQELRIRRPITVLMARGKTIPLTWGIVYPVVLLPSNAMEWPRSRRRAVVLHELAHIARFDAATQLLGQLVLAANWVNPLVWLATSRLRMERERACDDVVLNRGTRASAYASDLVMLVRSLQPAHGPGFASLAMARHSDLEQRVRSILDGGQRRTPMRRGRVTLSVFATIPLVTFVAAARPTSPTDVPRMQPTATSTPAPPPEPRLGSSQIHAASASLSAVAAKPKRPHLAPAPVVGRPTYLAGGGTRCPIESEFIHGGVSADAGKLATLDAVHEGSWILVVASDGRCVTARIDGTVTLTDDGGNVAGLGDNGRLVLTDVVDGHTRRAEIEAPALGHSPAVSPLYVVDGQIVDELTAADQQSPAGSAARPSVRHDGQIVGELTTADQKAPARSAARPIVRHYAVDAIEQPWDAGRTWFEAALSQVVRETAYDIHDREVRLRARGGVAAVLAEARRLGTDRAKIAYFKALVDTGPMSPDERRATIDAVQSSLPMSPDRDTILAHLRAGNPTANIHVF